MDNEWNLYKVNMKYIRNLKNVEQKATGRTNTILSVSTQTHKQGRPFLGILVLVNERKYCIPLSSVEEKEKYKSMSENITCRKIRDDDGNVIGILNINNMIPVRDEYLIPFELEELPTDTQIQLSYKRKCRQELKWCRLHGNEIIRLAQELHRIICSEERFAKRHICPDFMLLEKECDKQRVVSKRDEKKRNRKR